jgi:hypothetical protein
MPESHVIFLQFVECVIIIIIIIIIEVFVTKKWLSQKIRKLT